MSDTNIHFNSRHMKADERRRFHEILLILLDALDIHLPKGETWLQVETKKRLGGNNIGLSSYLPKFMKMSWHFVSVSANILNNKPLFTKILIHELVHVKQFQTGRLDMKRKHVYWCGYRYTTETGASPIDSNKITREEYDALPWEIEARSMEDKVYGYLVATSILTSVL